LNLQLGTFDSDLQGKQCKKFQLETEDRTLESLDNLFYGWYLECCFTSKLKKT